MIERTHFSLRTRLLLLVAAALLPALILIVWQALGTRAEAVAEARRDAQLLAGLTAGRLERFAGSARELITTLAVVPVVREAAPGACDRLLADIMTRQTRYANFGVTDAAGNLICSATPLKQAINFSDRPWFQKARDNHRFTTSDFLVGRATGKPSILFVMPLSDEHGRFHGTVFASLDLSQVAGSVADTVWPDGTTITILDREDTIIARYPDHEKWVGKPFPTEVPTAMRAAGENVTMKRFGVDGVLRTYVYQDIVFDGETQGVLLAGIPNDSYLARIDADLQRDLLWLALIAAVCFAIAGTGGNLLLRRLRLLIEAARRFGAGDLSARSGLAAQDEIGQLAAAFDQMAETVAGRGRELERRVAERTHQFEAALHEVEDLYDNAPCGYHSLDDHGTFVRINATELSWLGYTRDEMVGRMKFFDLLTPQSQDTFNTNFPRFLETGFVTELEFDLVRKDGSLLPVSLSASAVRDAAGHFVMSRSTLFDMTEHRRARTGIEYANAELAKASRLKSDFLASMSHELRTPLNAIIGFSELLKDGLAGEMTPKQKEYVENVYYSGGHLLSLINDILDLSKVEAGKMELQLEPVSLPSLLEACLTIVKEKAMAHRIRLSLEVDPEIGEMQTDPRKLKQIVYNYLSNAVKFTPDSGQVTLSARLVPMAALPPATKPGVAAERYLEVAVTDSGIGIAEGDMQRLFQTFVQIDSGLGRKYEGTGLGLSLVKKLAELFGGAVGVQSEPGKGSTFSVWLPWEV